MSLVIVAEKPAHTGTIADIRNWMRAESTREAWIRNNPNFGAAFFRYIANQEPDDVRRVFGIQPVCQLKEDAGVRGRGIHLFSIKEFEDVLWVSFSVYRDRN